MAEGIISPELARRLRERQMAAEGPGLTGMSARELLRGYAPPESEVVRPVAATPPIQDPLVDAGTMERLQALRPRMENARWADPGRGVQDLLLLDPRTRAEWDDPDRVADPRGWALRSRPSLGEARHPASRMWTRDKPEEDPRYYGLRPQMPGAGAGPEQEQLAAYESLLRDLSVLQAQEEEEDAIRRAAEQERLRRRLGGLR